MPINSPTTYTGQELTGLLTNAAAVFVNYQQNQKLGQIVIEPTIYPVALDTEGAPVVFAGHPYTPKDIKGKPEVLSSPVHTPFTPFAEAGGEWWLVSYQSGRMDGQKRATPADSILMADTTYEGLAPNHERPLANGGLLVVPAVNPYLRGGKHTNALMPLFEEGTLPDGLPEYKHTGVPVQLLTDSTRISQTDLKKQ